MKIYGAPIGSHLGDIWIIISGAILLSRQIKNKVYISKYAYDPKTFKNTDKINFENKMKECLTLLDSSGAEIEITNEFQNQHNQSSRSFIVPESCGYCINPPVKTILTPNEKSINKISIAIESKLFNKNKNAYEGIRDNWTNECRHMSLELKNDIYTKMLCLKNYKATIIGEHEGGVINSIKTLCESKIFIGISSGIAHIATSTGIPVYIYSPDCKDKTLNLSMIHWHKNKNVNIFKTFDEILDILNKHEIS
jgi:hypothetical protein